jgi:hypothetical protein
MSRAWLFYRWDLVYFFIDPPNDSPSANSQLAGDVIDPEMLLKG